MAGRTTAGSCWRRSACTAPVARGEIAKRVGLTVQTVSTIIRELELQGFVLGAREDAQGPRLSAELRSTSIRKAAIAIGVHVTPVGHQGGADQSRRRRDRRARTRDAPGRARPRLPRDRELVARLRKLRPQAAACSASASPCPGRSTSKSMSFVGPTTLEGWKGVHDPPSGSPRPTGLPAFVGGDVAARRHLASGSMARGATCANSTISISASASAAAWCTKASRCAGRAAMPARSAMCRSFPTASPARAAIADASSAISRSRRWNGAAPIVGEDGWIAEAAPLLARRDRGDREHVRSGDDHLRRPRAEERC